MGVKWILWIRVTFLHFSLAFNEAVFKAAITLRKFRTAKPGAGESDTIDGVVSCGDFGPINPIAMTFIVRLFNGSHVYE